jgi:hypothetical protein
MIRFCRTVQVWFCTILMALLGSAAAEPLHEGRTLECIHAKAAGTKSASSSARECVEWTDAPGTACFSGALRALTAELTRCCAHDHDGFDNRALAARCVKHLQDGTLLPSECTHVDCVELVAKPMQILRAIEPHFEQCVAARRRENGIHELRNLPAICRKAHSELMRASAQMRAVSRKGKGALYRDEL